MYDHVVETKTPRVLAILFIANTRGKKLSVIEYSITL